MKTTMKSAKKKVQLVEVGLRDGLQNEKQVISTELKVELAKRIVEAGSTRFEIGAFVSPKWVPQMAGTEAVIAGYRQLMAGPKNKSRESVLVPNLQGMQEASKLKVPEVAIFAAATESFSKRNINCSIEESFERFAEIMPVAKKNKIKVRGYLSVCFGCPFEGAVSEKQVVSLAEKLIKLGCYEVSIGDTIGIANAGQVQSLFKKLMKKIKSQQLAGHFHDTRGQALANILTSYQLGIRIFDTSIGGLGGCPFAPGATGNVATEDVVYMFQGLNVETGLDLPKLIESSRWLGQQMQKSLPSLVSRAGLAKST